MNDRDGFLAMSKVFMGYGTMTLPQKLHFWLRVPRALWRYKAGASW